MDCAIDCAAGPETTGQALFLRRNAGRVAITGIPTSVNVQVDASAMRRKELTLFNVRRSNHGASEALELLGRAGRVVCAAALRTRVSSIASMRLFAIVSQYRDGVGKMIVRP